MCSIKKANTHRLKQTLKVKVKILGVDKKQHTKADRGIISVV